VTVIFDLLSLTNPRDALHHGKRAANKQGEVDALSVINLRRI